MTGAITSYPKRPTVQSTPPPPRVLNKISLDEKLRKIEANYQVATDSMVNWQPSVLGVSVGGANRVTKTEAKLLDGLGVFQKKAFKGIVDDSLKTAVARVPPKGEAPQEIKKQLAASGLSRQEQASALASWPAQDGHTDAFRHAFWNARMTREFGENWAKQFGLAHEGTPDNANVKVREAMDLYNNEIGRSIGANNPNAS